MRNKAVDLPAKISREASAEPRAREGNRAKRGRASLGRQREKAAAVEESTYRQIVRAVMENCLRPGTKLDEDRLAKIFRISRTRLRKVISLLVNENIVVHQLNYGAFISRPSVKEARDVFETRYGVEEYLVQLMCRKKTPADLSRLEAFVRQEEKVYASGGAGTNRLSGDFHIILAELTGNDVLVSLMN